MKKIVALLLIAAVVCFKPCYADWFENFIEYRCYSDLGKIRISYSLVRGERYVNYLDQNYEKLEENNIFIGHKDRTKPRQHTRVETIGGRKIETVVTIYAPSGFGYGGLVWRAHIQISIDGIKKIDSSFGDEPSSRLVIEEINIFPEEDLISVRAVDYDKHILDLPSEYEFISSSSVITNKSFIIPQKEGDGAA